MIKNPYEECPPDSEQIEVAFTARLVDGTWEVWCPQWKCTLHDKSLTRALAQIAADIESHNDECNGIPTPSRNWGKWAKEQGINVRPEHYPTKPPKLRNTMPPDDGKRTPRVHLWQAPT